MWNESVIARTLRHCQVKPRGKNLLATLYVTAHVREIPKHHPPRSRMRVHSSCISDISDLAFPNWYQALTCFYRCSGLPRHSKTLVQEEPTEGGREQKHYSNVLFCGMKSVGREKKGSKCRGQAQKQETQGHNGRGIIAGPSISR